MTAEPEMPRDPDMTGDPDVAGEPAMAGEPDPGGEPGATEPDIPRVVDSDERWRLARSQFLESPRDAAAAADELIADAIATLTQRLDRQRADVADLWAHRDVDTETLRTAMLRYREVLDRLEAIAAADAPPTSPPRGS